MSYKVLVVDDESIIRRTIVRKLQNQGQFDIVEAEDGLQAMEYLRTDEIHAVILDILMPNMDGIDTLKEIMTINPEIVVVILSGYDDFEYVQNAINYGAKKYVLKPISMEELTSLCAWLYEVLQENSLRKREYEAYRKEVEENRFDIESRIFSDFLSRELTAEQWIRKCSLQKQISGSVWQAACVLCEQEPGSEISSQISYKILENHLRSYAAARNFLCYRCRNEGFVLVFPAESVEPEALFSELREEIRSCYRIDVTVGIGLPVSALSMLPMSYEQAISASLQRGLLGSGVFLLDPSVKGASLCNYAVLLSGIYRSMTSKRYEQILESVQQEFVLIRENRDQYNYLMLQTLALQYLGAFVAVMTEYQLEPETIFMTHRNPYQKLLSLTNLEDIEAWILKSCENLIEAVQATEQSSNLGIVHAVQGWLREHHAEEISLQTLGKQFGYSANYLGQVFKQETGTSVGEYLANIRIEAAKDLLLSSDYSMQEVAERCGFADQSYFSNVFKKKTGLSPRKYKQSGGDTTGTV